MIIKSWKFKGFKSEIPDWVKLESSKRAGNPDLWIHTQRGEEPAKIGQWISVSLRGHLDIHDKKPDGVAKDLMAGAALVVMIAVALVVMLAM